MHMARSCYVGDGEQGASISHKWPLNHLFEAAAVLKQDRRNGWTLEQRIELLRQRWLADARRESPVWNIPGRSAGSAWPQLTRLRKTVGDTLFTLGQRPMTDDERSRFIAGLQQMSSERGAAKRRADEQFEAVAAKRVITASSSDMASSSDTAVDVVPPSTSTFLSMYLE